MLSPTQDLDIADLEDIPHFSLPHAVDSYSLRSKFISPGSVATTTTQSPMPRSFHSPCVYLTPHSGDTEEGVKTPTSKIIESRHYLMTQRDDHGNNEHINSNTKATSVQTVDSPGPLHCLSSPVDKQGQQVAKGLEELRIHMNRQVSLREEEQVRLPNLLQPSHRQTAIQASHALQLAKPNPAQDNSNPTTVQPSTDSTVIANSMKFPKSQMTYIEYKSFRDINTLTKQVGSSKSILKNPTNSKILSSKFVKLGTAPSSAPVSMKRVEFNKEVTVLIYCNPSQTKR